MIIRILVMLNIGGFNFSSTNYGISGAGQLRRKIASGSFASIGIGNANAIWNATFVLPQYNSYTYNSVHAIYLDSPNTTSEIEYQFRIQSGGGAGNIEMTGGVPHHFILTEIAG